MEPIDDVPNPHDSLFRRVLGEPANAAAELRAVLPAAVAARIAWDRLVLLSGSFVDEELRQRHSDLLFSAPLGRDEALVYLLFEGQSRVDPLMAYRLLRYIVRIWDRWLRDNPLARKLPAVIPIVLHHDRRAWTAPTQLLDLIDLDATTVDLLREHLPQLRFLLDDLARVDERALRERHLPGMVLLTLTMLKAPGDNAQVSAALHHHVEDLRLLSRDDLTSILLYAMLTTTITIDDLRPLTAKLGPTAEEAIMTTAEKLRAEGEAQGRAEGEAQGRAEGKAQGRVDALVQLLTLKFGSLSPTVLDQLHAATVSTLQTWTARVLTAKTLDEVLA